MTSITIELSDDLAARAQRAGVLRSAFVNALIEEATTCCGSKPEECLEGHGCHRRTRIDISRNCQSYCGSSSRAQSSS